MSTKETLLDWCKRCAKNYPEVEIRNYTTSWKDGLAFNALLHSYRPELFDFKELVSKSPIERLENAFKIMSSKYYINPNATPLEILVKPDRNKITKILSMLYESLNDENSSDEYENSNLNSESKLIIKRYQEDVEDVLTWILGAEEKLNIEQENNSKSEESLDTIQQIFQSLEEFTADSTDRQKKIEDILQEGQLLMRSALSNEDEIKEIQVQRDLLNDKWEELKNMIMDTQERLHNTLMSLQKKQLNDFSNWLKTAEDKISTFSEIEDDLELTKQQYKEHMEFQTEVREHEPMVKTLSNMVIIIDECENPNFSSENLTDDLVDQLEALAEKWKNVCTIVEERETTLSNWVMLLEQESKFNVWVMKIAKRIQDIESAAREQSTSSVTSFLNNLINRLDKMKKEVNVQLVYYSSEFDQAKVQLRKINKDSQAAIRIKDKIDVLSKQWNEIMDRMNLLSSSIKKMYRTLNEQNKLERQGSIRSKTEENQPRKRYKLDKWKLEEWQKCTRAFIRSTRKYAQMLGVERKEAIDEEEVEADENTKSDHIAIDDLDFKEQEILVDEVQNEFEDKEIEYQNLVQQVNFLIEELKKLTEEDTDPLEELLNSMKLKWNELKDALNDKYVRLSVYASLSKLHSECEVLIRAFNHRNNRLDNEKIMIKRLNTQQNYNEINKIYEQCKLRNQTLLAQKKRVSSIEAEFKDIIKQFPKLANEDKAKDLKYFLNYWQETNRKINDFQQEVESILKLGKLVKRKEEKLSETYPKLVKVIDLLEKWLIKTYQIVLIGQLNLYWTREEYDEQLKSFRELERDINNERENLDYINETGEKVIQLHADASWTPAFKSKVRDLNRKWSETIAILNSKIEHLDRLQDLVPKLDTQMNEFWIWLESAQEFLKDSIEFGDFEMMEQQIAQYDALLADMDGEVLKSIEIINEYYKTIKEIINKSPDTNLLTSNLSLNELPKGDEEKQDNNRQFKEALNQKIKEVIENCTMFHDEAISKRDILVESLRECRKIDEKISNFDKEIEKIKCDRLMISDIDLLNEHCYSLESTKERLVKNLNSCTKMKGNLENLNELGKFKTKVCLEKIINKIKAVEEKCTSVIEEISTICSNGKTIKVKYDELCRMYNSRSHWLDKLEQIISKSTQELVDSDEISDYLENLENHLRDKPDDVCLDKVEELINDLNELFFDAIKYVDKQEERWMSTTAEAGNPNKQLLQILGETQELEGQMLILRKELEFIESSLESSPLNEPEEDEHQLNIEGLENKFKEANQMLSFLNEQIHKLLAEQRNIAANRFKAQLKVLQINYTELNKKFNEMKSLPNVEIDKHTLIDDLKRAFERTQNKEQLTDSQADLIQKELHEITEPLAALESRIQEIQKSSYSIEDNEHSSQPSISKSHSDLDLSTSQPPPPSQTNGLTDTTSYNETDLMKENLDMNAFNSSNNDYEDEVHEPPQAIEINLNLDNSQYLSIQDELFEDSVDHPWERCVTNNYVPYYKNHEIEATFWNHPNMTLLMDDLTEINEIYYAAYRTSIKLRTIQQALFLNCIHITNMCKIFDTFDFLNDDLVTVPEMILVFKRIYEDISAKVTPITNLGLIIDMALNWVLNLYDLDRTGYIKLLAFKTSLVCMSRASIEEKYKVLFQLTADSKGFADRQSVGNLLKYMLEIPKLLGDIAAFGGSNFEPSIRSCFEEAQDKNQLNVKKFLCWLKREPQSLVWLPLLHRIIIAEGSRHPNKCSVCKAYPIVGFRYKCLKCFNCDICQNCFLLRRPLSGHKYTHPIKEYCYVSGSSRKDVSDFSKIVRNKFKSSRKSFRKHFADSYLPVKTVLDNMDSFEETKMGLDRNGISLLQYSQNHQEDGLHNNMEFFANKLAEAELNDTSNSFNVNNYSDNMNGTQFSGGAQLHSTQIHNSHHQDFKLSKRSDEHDLIMNYCNILNGTANSSVLSNKFASLNDSSSKVSQSSSSRKMNNGYLSSQDYLNDELDEHQLVKNYCSILANSKAELGEVKNPKQVLSDLSENGKEELSFLIRQLEKENSILENDYQELKKQKYDPSDYEQQVNGGDFQLMKQSQSREEMLIEKFQLEQHSRNLEQRMQILEKKNQALQNQLSKLKLFLDQDCN